jgi:predicted mannosyl-3-phosphoglycerate phosphatase (HAD superfamily)
VLARAAARRGLQLSHGGRFHHLMGGSDKGLAVRTLLAAYHRGGHQPLSAGLGDAETDLTLLKAVDRPIVVPRPDGRIEMALASALPTAERAPLPGPPGWNAAVLTLLAGQGLPRVGDAPTDAGA